MKRASRLMVSALVLGAAIVVPGVVPGTAHAYEFEIEAKSVGQGYQLRWIRFSERDRLLNRRRFTQYLRLHITDILAPSIDPAFPDKKKKAPFDLYFSSAMRFDNDFGDHTQGDVRYGITVDPITGDPLTFQNEPATDAIPELEQLNMNLELLYAIVGGKRLFGFLDFQLGRQLTVDTLDWFAFDGLTLRARTPWWFAIEAHGGLLVRDSSPLGSAVQEPDGTSSSLCRRVDEDTENWTTAEDCLERDTMMPTFGFAAETYGLRKVQARIAYRRSQSETVTEIYQPLERGAVPAWGVNEEKGMASVRGNFYQGGIVPWVAARWNFLLATVDEAQAGVRLAWAEHAITPELIYSFPSFEGNSIFNVFSSEPYTDARVTYDIWPGRGRLRGYARGFVRQFENTDMVRCTGVDPDTGDEACMEGEELASDAVLPSSDRAYGVGVGARLRLSDRGRVRGDLFYDDGYGGLRAGVDTSGRYRISKNLEAEGRLSLIRFEEDSIEDLQATTFGVQAGARYLLGKGMALHLLVEENINRFETSQFRVIGVLDLAFRPEF